MKNVTKAPKGEGRTPVAFSAGKTIRNATRTGWFLLAASVFAVIDLQLNDAVQTGIDYLIQEDSPIYQIIAGTPNEPVLLTAASSAALMFYTYVGIVK